VFIKSPQRTHENQSGGQVLVVIPDKLLVVLFGDFVIFIIEASPAVFLGTGFISSQVEQGLQRSLNLGQKKLRIQLWLSAFLIVIVQRFFRDFAVI
jgi:hypothetical protein